MNKVPIHQFVFAKAVVAAWFAAICIANAADAATKDIRIALPKTIYAASGVEMSAYYSNAVFVTRSDSVSFRVVCPIGESDAKRWTLTPTAQQSGDYPFALEVLDASNRVLALESSVLRVVKSDAGHDKEIALLIVGDSLTHASQYPNEVARLLSQLGNPQWRMLGTHRPASAATNVAHEGYGGWTWRAFNTRFEPTRPFPGSTNSSPFVFPGTDPQKPTLDVSRYLAERCGGRTPDYVTFLLGINDCFRLKADNPTALDAGISEMFKEADKLLAEFRKAAPRAELGVCLTTPPNDRDAAFVANYKTNYTRANWRAVQQRIVERQLEHFSGREQEGIFLVPTHLNLDTFAGYPENNAVHPNVSGYQQIGASVYCWIKSRLAAKANAK